MERRFRLRRSSDVRRVYDKGKSWVHPLLVLVAHRNELGFSRVAVTASRRVGHAADRNRAKRLMREAARHLHPQFESGWDIVLVARPRILGAKEPQVEDALDSLLERAHLKAKDSNGALTGSGPHPTPSAEEMDK